MNVSRKEQIYISRHTEDWEPSIDLGSRDTEGHAEVEDTPRTSGGCGNGGGEFVRGLEELAYRNYHPQSVSSDVELVRACRAAERRLESYEPRLRIIHKDVHEQLVARRPPESVREDGSDSLLHVPPDELEKYLKRLDQAIELLEWYIRSSYAALQSRRHIDTSFTATDRGNTRSDC